MLNDENILLRNLSTNINKIMKKQGLSIPAFAKYTGMTEAEVRNLKENRNKKLNTTNIMKIIQCFSISPNELLGIGTIPEELGIRSEHTEFKTSFYEKDGGDFTYYNKCDFLKSYDEEYEKCVVNGIHSMIEAHKLATGYYCKDFPKENVHELSKDVIEKRFADYNLDKFFDDYEKRKNGDSPKIENTVPKIDENMKEKSNSVTSIGRTITKMRKRYKISRKELAEKTKLGEDCLFRIESGKNKHINFHHINLIAGELLCTPEFLLGESCDPTAGIDGKSRFYHRDEFIFRHVQLGHDLAYAFNYMDEDSKNMIISSIRYFNMMYHLREVNNTSGAVRMTVQEVFFREQEQFDERRKNRGAKFYTTKYQEEL